MALKHLTALAAAQQAIALEEHSIAMEGVKETLSDARDKLVKWAKVLTDKTSLGETTKATIESAAYIASAMNSLKAKISASAPEHLEIKGVTRVLRRLGITGKTSPEIIREIKEKQKLFQLDVKLAHAAFKRAAHEDGKHSAEYQTGLACLEKAQRVLKASNPGLSVAMKLEMDKRGLLNVIQAMIEFMNAIQGTLRQYDFSKFDFSDAKPVKTQVAQEGIAQEGLINAVDGTDGVIFEFLHTVLITGLTFFSLYLLFANIPLGIAAFWGTNMLNKFINWLLYGGAGSHENGYDDGDR